MGRSIFRMCLFVTAMLAAFSAFGEDAVPVPGPAPQPVDGERIGTIYVSVRDIFDTTKPGENKALYRLANRLHVDTREEALRAQLLFAEGDPYSKRIVEET